MFNWFKKKKPAQKAEVKNQKPETEIEPQKSTMCEKIDEVANKIDDVSEKIEESAPVQAIVDTIEKVEAFITEKLDNEPDSSTEQ